MGPPEVAANPAEVTEARPNPEIRDILQSTISIMAEIKAQSQALVGELRQNRLILEEIKNEIHELHKEQVERSQVRTLVKHQRSINVTIIVLYLDTQ
jgi:hypothetical protein